MYDRKNKIFVKREPTIEISVNFLKSFYSISNYIDKKYNLNCSELIKKDMSKYIYPSLSIHRDKGLKIFFQYFIEIHKLGLTKSMYSIMYFLGLTLFGSSFCDNLIVKIKNFLGHTPKL